MVELQGLAVLESKHGNYRAAQQVFQQGADKCPSHAPLFNAWAGVEASFFGTLHAALIKLESCLMLLVESLQLFTLQPHFALLLSMCCWWW